MYGCTILVFEGDLKCINPHVHITNHRHSLSPEQIKGLEGVALQGVSTHHLWS